jgi:hypothetical protein
MYLVRDVFRCKPGNSRALAEKFKMAMSSMEKVDGFKNGRVMVDAVAEYWTVVLQAEVDSLEMFESHMKTFSSRPEIKEALAGYMDLVEEGHREIYRLI